jgi:hypothetical protein
VVLLGATALGIFLAHRGRQQSETLREPFGILQGSLLGIVALLLAFGLSLAVSRYEDRRANDVSEANAIGTTYLRAQTLPEPIRSRSLDLLVHYTRTAVRLSDHVPGGTAVRAAVASEQRDERQLWRLAGEALNRAPIASAPRLYAETLNEMFDAETVRVAALANRVPTAVLVLEIVGSAVALGLLAAYLALHGRGVLGVVVASALVAFLLLVTADLDGPTRGLIRVPDTVLKSQLQSMSCCPRRRLRGPHRSPARARRTCRMTSPSSTGGTRCAPPRCQRGGTGGAGAGGQPRTLLAAAARGRSARDRGLGGTLRTSHRFAERLRRDRGGGAA